MSVFDMEKSYMASNGVEIHYLEDPYSVQNYEGEQKIIFIFQSLGNEKSENEVERYPWTMVNGFKFLNCRKIYVKDDYGLVGCFYLGLNGKFDVESAVEEFIRRTIKEKGILLKNVIFYGNSKGGYAALDFGFKIGGGNICAAVPQYDLYSFVTKYKPHLKYIFSTDEAVNTQTIYKEHLEKVIVNSVVEVREVAIITSHNDNTYAEHIPPLLNALNKKEVNYQVIYNDEFFVTQHNNVVVNSLNWIYYIICKWLLEGGN